MAFKDDLKTFYDSAIELIKKTEAEKIEPFNSLVLLQTIKAELESYNSIAKKSIARLVEHKKNYNKSFDLILENYNQTCEKINNDYEVDIKNINSDVTQKTNDLSLQNDNIKNDLRNKTTEFELHVSWIKNENEQNINFFKTECENSIARFDHQFENSKVAYNETVSYYNSELKEQLKTEGTRYEDDLIDYDYGTEALTDRYHTKIEEQKNALNKYVDKFNMIQTNQKEKKYIEAVDLNTKIRTLVNETNQRNVAEKIDYSKDQNVNKIEHDMKRRELLLEAQQISKEFVLNMDRLDLQMNNYKESYNTKKTDIEKDLYYNLLKKHKEEENSIKDLIFDESKETKKRIKKLQKFYYSQKKNEKAKTTSTLSNIEKDFLKKTAANNYEKKVLDLNRSYDLKINNEKENADNKYFQELNNIDENDFNYKTKIHNNNYNLNANILKLDNAIKQLKMDSNYEKENINHQIEIQKLTNELRKTKLDLSTLVKIQEKTHDYKSLVHEKYVKFLTIYNLLEIEKCKTLAEFNQRNYNQNVENAKKILELSKRNIHMQNMKTSNLNDLMIERETILAEKEIYNNDQKINMINVKANHEIESKARTLVYDTDLLSYGVLFNRFKLELELLNRLITTYVYLIKELEHSTTYIVDKIFDNINLRPEYIEVVRTMLINIFKIIYRYYVSLTNTFKTHEETLIDGRISFEKEFKFKANYEELHIEFTAKYEDLYSKKTVWEDKLKNINTEIDANNQVLFTIKNQIAMAKNHFNNPQYDSKKNARKNLALLRRRQKYLEEELLKNIEEENNIKKHIIDINSEIEQLNEENEKRENEISTLQYNGAISYYNMKREYNSSFSNISNIFKNKLFNIDETVDVTSYEKIIIEKRSDLLKFNDSIFKLMYNIMHNFAKDAFANIEKAEKITINKYRKDIDNINNSLEDECAAIQATIDATNKEFENKLIENQKKKVQTERYYNSMEKNFANEQQSTSKNSVLIKEKIEQQFYSEFYAIRDNQAMIVKDYEESIAKYNQESLKFEENQMLNLDIEKRKIDAELKALYKQKHEYIKELPERVKNQEESLIKDTKEKNKSIQKQKVQDKFEYIASRSEFFKNLTNLNVNYSVKLKSINYERKHRLRQAKKRYSSDLRRI